MGVHPPETGAVSTDGSGPINGATVSMTHTVSARLFFYLYQQVSHAESMKIQSITSDLFYIPLPEVLTDSTHGVMEHFALVTVRIRDNQGLEGLGYTYTVGKTGGAAILSMLEYDIKRLLLGEDPNEIDRIFDKLWWALHYIGRGGIASFAISAVDIALWDLKSKRANQPLWKFLGGVDDQVKAYAGGIDLQLPIDRLEAQTQENLDRGFRAIKMKVGRDKLEEDVKRVAAMRDFLGPDLPLMVDANMRWSVNQATEAAKAFADYNIYWLEEPVIPEDFQGHRRVLAEGGIPIASGENLHTIYEFEKLITAGGVSYPEPDVANVGGITIWRKVAQMAEQAGLPVTSHGVHDLHVHLLAAAPNASFLEAHGFGLERFLEYPLQIEEGFATAPSRTGHGVCLDWDALEHHRGPNLN